MGYKVGILILVLVFSCVSGNARSPVTLNAVVTEVDDKIQSASKVAEAIGSNGQLCTLCEEFTSQAIYYLSENKTQNEIIGTLHKACSQMHSLSQQCFLLVDYYAPLFFMEIAMTSPERFCEKVNLCQDVALLHLPNREDTCTLCHRFLTEVLAKLKDPETELDIIETLLKGCNKVDNYVQQCKKLILEYGPIILVNAEKFLETTDICKAIRACKGNQEVMAETALASA